MRREFEVLKRLERGITSPNERYGDGRNTIEMILRTDSSQRRPDRNAHGGQFQHPWNNGSSVSKENTLHGEPVGSSTSSTCPVPGERFIASSRNMDFLSESKPNRNRPANGSERHHVDSMWQGDTFQFRIRGVKKVYFTGFTDSCSRYRVKSKQKYTASN